MPKANQKRGRREEKKRKRDDGTEGAHGSKRQRSEEPFAPGVAEQYTEDDDQTHAQERVFFGMLDEQEQEYFRRADEMLELNQFANAEGMPRLVVSEMDGLPLTVPEERSLFLANVYKEADGKELKIACSQSCSRLMERLILLSSPAQLKALFAKFSGQSVAARSRGESRTKESSFLHLVQHRFASHCCEALFLQAAPVVTQELLAPYRPKNAEINDDIFVSMENMFLFTLNDLEGNFGYLMTDQHASHPLRLLVIILSGRPLAKSSTTSLLRSKRKETITVTGLTSDGDAPRLEQRQVPEAFDHAIEKIVAETISTLDITSLQSLASHPTGNPFLQLLLEIELARSSETKSRREHLLLDKLLTIEAATDEASSSSFLTGMLYDPIGSRLLETIVTFAPGKTFKILYRTFFKDKIRQQARNETAGYVVIKVLERLSMEDLQAAVQAILPEISSLAERSRTAIIKTMVERCSARKADTQPLANAIQEAYSENGDFRLWKVLKWDGDDATKTTGKPDDASKEDMGQLHGSLLAQAMLAVPGPLSDLIYNSLLALQADSLLCVAERPMASHVLQASVTLPTSSASFRRKIMNILCQHVARLAVHPAGSHVVDALWKATQGLGNYRERIADELLANEAQLRDSYVGRAVWRNWMIDLYSRRKTDWIAKSKTSETTHPRPDTDVGRSKEPTQAAPGKKSGIELARAKFAASRALSGKRGTAATGTGANAVSKVSAI